MTVQLTVCSCLQSGLNIEPSWANRSGCVGGAGGASEPPPNLPLAMEPVLSVLVHTSSFQKQPPVLRPTCKNKTKRIQQLVILSLRSIPESLVKTIYYSENLCLGRILILIVFCNVIVIVLVWLTLISLYSLV